MIGDTTVELQALIDRMQQGDRQACGKLLERAHGRLQRLAGRILYGSFAVLRNRHDLESVVDEAWLRLLQAVDKAKPPTAADFFRLAAHKIRQVLLDMVARERRRLGREVAFGNDLTTDQAPVEPSDQSHDPVRLAQWTELHQLVASLPDQERTVFEMHYYLDIPQAEITHILGLHPRKVSYLWVAATDKLARSLSKAEAFV